jgi:hypothetical protein
MNRFDSAGRIRYDNGGNHDETRVGSRGRHGV